MEDLQICVSMAFYQCMFSLNGITAHRHMLLDNCEKLNAAQRFCRTLPALVTVTAGTSSSFHTLVTTPSSTTAAKRLERRLPITAVVSTAMPAAAVHCEASAFCCERHHSILERKSYRTRVIGQEVEELGVLCVQLLPPGLDDEDVVNRDDVDALDACTNVVNTCHQAIYCDHEWQIQQ